MHRSPRSITTKALGLNFLDIAPSYGRLVLFRSEEVEHEVLPTDETRIALTVWAYGDDHEGRWASSAPEPPSERLLPVGAPHECSIFVSIAAYRDPECIPTLVDLFEKAKHKSEVFVGVVWQGEGSDFSLDTEPPLREYISQIRVIRMSYRDSTGPCLARHIAQSLWRREKFYLQIDSHMRFRLNWDEMLISLLNYCKTIEGIAIECFDKCSIRNHNRFI